MTTPKPIRDLMALADDTPNPCEGSLGHVRQDFADDLFTDFRLAASSDPVVKDLYPDGMTYGEIMAACVASAAQTVNLWTATR